MTDEEKSSDSAFKPKKWRQYLPAFIASQGTLALGTVLGWSSPAIPTMIKDELGEEVTAIQKTWITSFALLGAFLSALPAGYALKKMGPRRLMLLQCFPMFIGWLQVIFANSVRMFYFGRFILGFTGGPFLLAVPMYITEITSDKHRVHLSGLTLVQLVHGVFFAYLKGALAPWKWLSVSMAGIPVMTFIGLYFMPESPGYLFSQGKETEATKALKWFRGATDVAQIEPELKLIKASRGESNDATPKMKLKDWLCGPIQKPLLLICVLFFIQQWSGVIMLIMHSVTIFDTAATVNPTNKMPLSSNLSAIIVGFALVLGMTAAGLMVKKVGKKIPMFVSSVGTAVGWTTMGIYFFLTIQNLVNRTPAPDGLQYIPIIALVATAFLYTLGLGTVPWMILSDFVPYNLLGTATAIAATCYWLSAFILIVTFELVARSIGIFTLYWIFAGICLCGALFAHLIIPQKSNNNSQESLQKVSSSDSIATSRM